jgi:hypothetical protein
LPRDSGQYSPIKPIQQPPWLPPPRTCGETHDVTGLLFYAWGKLKSNRSRAAKLSLDLIDRQDVRGNGQYFSVFETVEHIEM